MRDAAPTSLQESALVTFEFQLDHAQRLGLFLNRLAQFGNLLLALLLLAFELLLVTADNGFELTRLPRLAILALAQFGLQPLHHLGKLSRARFFL